MKYLTCLVLVLAMALTVDATTTDASNTDSTTTATPPDPTCGYLNQSCDSIGNECRTGLRCVDDKCIEGLLTGGNCGTECFPTCGFPDNGMCKSQRCVSNRTSEYGVEQPPFKCQERDTGVLNASCRDYTSSTDCFTGFYCGGRVGTQGGKCFARLAAGENCANDRGDASQICLEGLFCNGTIASDITCIPQVANGGPCADEEYGSREPNNHACANGFCNTSSLTCAEFWPEGAACDVVSTYTSSSCRCSSSTNTCCPVPEGDVLGGGGGSEGGKGMDRGDGDGDDDCPSLKESTCGLAPSCSWSSGSCVFSECSDSSDLCIGLFSQGVCSTPVISLYPDAPAGERDLVSGGCRKECKLCVDTGPTEQEVYVTMAMTFDQAIDAAQEIQIADKIKTIYLNKLPDSVSNVMVSIQPSRRRRRHLLEGVEYTVTITITVEATAQELTTEFDRVKSELAPEYYTGDETFQALIQADVETLGVTVTVSEPIIQCSPSTTFDCGGSQLAPFTGIVGVLLAVRLLALG